ncbi:hypothetical protein [Candidatus Soleaferrea massiliensis]|uniref:hypothetical protein n=1 Tax=Candidatus Soleaferrea massiliensis TaxID=1470354 RepID=UPI000590E035|nr:hypothetical protein [Candidatus Soleaferrea massiliensis]
MFQIELIWNQNNKSTAFFIPPQEYETGLDNHLSVIADICDVFEESGCIQFHVSGFGEALWRLDCRFDLCSVFDQIVEAVNSLENGQSSFTIDFFEQGTERTLNFRENDKNDEILLTMSELLAGECNSETERIAKHELLEMFREFIRSFLKFSSNLCPSLIAHELFIQWFHQYIDFQDTSTMI